MTPVLFHFVTPNGDPLVNALVKVQLIESAFDIETSGVLMPRLVEGNTDLNGRLTLNLWAHTSPYIVSVLDTISDVGLQYTFFVPEQTASVRLQDIVVPLEVSDIQATITLSVIQAAEASVVSAKNTAAANAAAAAASATASSASAATSSAQATIATIKATEAATSATAASGSATLSTTKATEAFSSAASAAASASTASAAVIGSVRFDVTQTLSAPEQTQARANIGFLAGVRGAVLTGLSLVASTTLTAGHTVLEAFGFLQKQITDWSVMITSHLGSTTNPHAVTKSQVGLGNADNTSDVNKPISTAQTAADLVVKNAAALDASTKANARQAALISGVDYMGSTAFSSPVFTGNPVAPTQLIADNSTRLATTKFVKDVVAASATGIAPLGGVVIPDFVMNTSTPNNRVNFPNTNPAGWNVNVGRKTVDFEMQSVGYFAANPIGHMAMVLRCTMSLIDTAVRGQGLAMGNAVGFGQPNDLNPTPVIETWHNGFGNNNFIWENSGTARTFKMLDNVFYRFIIDSTKTNDGNRFIRYRLYSRQTDFGDWRAEVDTGDVLDHNIHADLTQTGLVFANVFRSDLIPWAVYFGNIKVTWGPAEVGVPDQTVKVSRFGADVEGDLRFIGNGRRLQIANNPGPSLVPSTAVQSQGVNTATSLVVIPNGTSNTANLIWANTSNPSASYGAVMMGISGLAGDISTFGYNGADPPFKINIGFGNTVALFDATGMYVKGAAKAIGPVSLSLTGMQNIGGSAATTFTNSAIDFESAATDGVIRTYMSPSPTAEQIEIVLRPLYCYMSALLAELRNRKVI